MTTQDNEVEAAAVELKNACEKYARASRDYATAKVALAKAAAEQDVADHKFTMAMARRRGTL